MNPTSYNKPTSGGTIPFAASSQQPLGVACNNMGNAEYTSVLDKIMRRVAVGSTGCWEWTGGKSNKGYGYTTWAGKQVATHRLVWIHLKGAIPSHLCVDHICRNRACCNPEHLRLVTPAQNAMENNAGFAPVNTAKTHCKRGHEFTPKNTIIRQRYAHKNNMGRSCRTCEQVRQKLAKRKWRAERRAKKLLCGRDATIEELRKILAP